MERIIVAGGILASFIEKEIIRLAIDDATGGRGYFFRNA